MVCLWTLRCFELKSEWKCSDKAFLILVKRHNEFHGFVWGLSKHDFAFGTDSGKKFQSNFLFFFVYQILLFPIFFFFFNDWKNSNMDLHRSQYCRVLGEITLLLFFFFFRKQSNKKNQLHCHLQLKWSCKIYDTIACSLLLYTYTSEVCGR